MSYSRYMQLEKHLIPTILIKYVSQEEEDGVDDDGVTPVTYVSTVINFRDGTKLTVDEDFDVICELLNPIM